MYTVEAMWSRPILMPPVNSRARDSPGLAACSSHTAEAWVMVTSLRTPRPAMTMPQVSREVRLRPGTRLMSVTEVSSLAPVRLAAPVPHRDSPTVMTTPAKVPSSAVVVRTEIPWAT